MKEDVYIKANRIMSTIVELETVLNWGDLLKLDNRNFEFLISEGCMGGYDINKYIKNANEEIHNSIKRRIAELQAEFYAL